MTDALDSLFNSPPGPSRPPPPLSPRSISRTPSPSPQRARARQSSEPLFLSPGQTPVRARPLVDFEPEDDPFAEFENRYRAGGSGAADQDPGIPTSALGAYDPLAPLGGNADDGEELPSKKRRPIPKIDADRLMGEYGLPALMREAKRFKVKGKGHEGSDLKALLQTYQIWAHRMFPKGDFMGTMTRVENNLRTRRMENAMKGYRDAFHPPPARSPSPPAPGDGLLTPPPDDEPISHSSNQPEGSTSQSNGHRISNGRNVTSHGNGEGRNQREEPLFDDVDYDEIVAMEEMEREEATRQKRAASSDGSEPPVLQEEDEWEGLYD